MGLTNPHLKKALNDAALVLVGWDVRAYDKKNEPIDTIARVIGRTRDGSIIAMHDGGVSPEKLLATVSGVIIGLQSRGYRLVPLAELLDHS
jgi:peptidoglycan/xylan/chitin deacetylase (PgdA/CDA1 family)